MAPVKVAQQEKEALAVRNRRYSHSPGSCTRTRCILPLALPSYQLAQLAPFTVWVSRVCPPADITCMATLPVEARSRTNRFRYPGAGDPHAQVNTRGISRNGEKFTALPLGVRSTLPGMEPSISGNRSMGASTSIKDGLLGGRRFRSGSLSGGRFRSGLLGGRRFGSGSLSGGRFP